MLKNKFILFSFIFVSIHSYGQIYDYEPIQFHNLIPIWLHVSKDSTMVDNQTFDGMNHFAFVNDIPLPHLIKDNYLYLATNTQFSTKVETEGALIEKINLSNGYTSWVNSFDLRNNNRLEYVEGIYLNRNNNIEVVSDRTINSILKDWVLQMEIVH